MRNKAPLFAILAAAILCLAAPIRSAESGLPPLPKGLSFHVSVKSLPELIEQIDQMSAKLTQGTRYAMPPGIFTQLAAIYSPLPDSGWERDAECHLLSFMEGDFVGMAIMFHAKNLQGLLDALAEEGAPAEKNDALDAYDVEFPGLGDSLLADAGKGMMIIANNGEMLKIVRDALAKWTPGHWGDGVLSAVVNIPEGWTERSIAIRDIRRALDDMRNLREKKGKDAFKPLADFGIKPEVVKGMVELIEQYMPQIIAEAAKADAVYLGTDFHGDRLDLAWRFAFTEPSVAGQLAASAMRRANLDSPMLAYAGKNAAAINLSAPAEDVLPGINAMFLSLTENAVAKMYPERREAVASLWKKLINCQMGEYMLANYFEEDGEYTASWLVSKDAERLLQLQAEGIDLMNAMVNETILFPDYRFTLKSTDGKTADGTPYRKTTIVLDNPAKVEELLASLPQEGAQIQGAVEKLRNFTQYAGVRNGMVVAVAGQATEEHFVAALKAVDAQPEPFIKQPEAEAALKGVKSSQSSLLLVDVDKMVEFFVRQMVLAANQGIQEDADAMLADILPELVTSGGIVSASLGAAGGLVAIDSSIPMSAINAANRNYEKYLTLSGVIVTEPEFGEDEEYDGEGEMEEDSPEEEEDAPAEEDAAESA